MLPPIGVRAQRQPASGRHTEADSGKRLRVGFRRADANWIMTGARTGGRVLCQLVLLRKTALLAATCCAIIPASDTTCRSDGRVLRCSISWCPRGRQLSGRLATGIVVQWRNQPPLAATPYSLNRVPHCPLSMPIVDSCDRAYSCRSVILSWPRLVQGNNRICSGRTGAGLAGAWSLSAGRGK